MADEEITIQPWLDEDGNKIMDFDGTPWSCPDCPCCTICEELEKDPPDGYQKGVRFEIEGIPCSGYCSDTPQTFTVDYHDYADEHPGWQTCIWREQDPESECWHWYVVTPECEVYEWAYLLDCDSSSSSSSSSSSGSSSSGSGSSSSGSGSSSSGSGSSSSGSGSSSSGSGSSSSSSSSSSMAGCYCQEVLEIRLKEWYSEFWIGSYPCGTIPSMTPEELVAYILAHGYQQYTQTLYQYYCIDDDGNVTEGTRQDQLRVCLRGQCVGDNSVDLWNAGCYKHGDEQCYCYNDPECETCGWMATPYYLDKPLYYVKSERKVDSPSECRNPEPEDPWMMAVPQEDELI